MQIAFIIETWTGGECLPCQVSSVFVTGLQCDYQEEIWALESCHIPAHCKSPASSINLITAECTGQIFIGFSFSLLSPPLLNTNNSSLSSIPLKCERGRWRFCQHWLSDQIFLSIHTSSRLCPGSKVGCLQWGQFISIGWQRGRRAVIDAQWHCSWLSTWCPPPLASIWSQAATYLSFSTTDYKQLNNHSARRVYQVLWSLTEFIWISDHCWKQYSFNLLRLNVLMS